GTGCASCASSAPITTVPPTNFNSGSGGLEPTPALPPNSNVPETRVNRPDTGIDAAPPLDNPANGSDVDDATSWFEAPQLFDGRDRSASRPTTNVWNAVYQQPVGNRAATAQRTAYRPTTQPAAPRNRQVGAGGWRSAD
ncbi:MAG: hypothetical protein AAGF31_07945, partial [Planctomycetota bacterium]